MEGKGGPTILIRTDKLGNLGIEREGKGKKKNWGSFERKSLLKTKRDLPSPCVDYNDLIEGKGRLSQKSVTKAAAFKRASKTRSEKDTNGDSTKLGARRPEEFLLVSGDGRQALEIDSSRLFKNVKWEEENRQAGKKKAVQRKVEILDGFGSAGR